MVVLERRPLRLAVCGRARARVQPLGQVLALLLRDLCNMMNIFSIKRFFRSPPSSMRRSSASLALPQASAPQTAPVQGLSMQGVWGMQAGPIACTEDEASPRRVCGACRQGGSSHAHEAMHK
jgi:hypothetical protein